MDKEKNKLVFKFIKSEDHKSFVSNRIWGGLQDGGLFELNFLLEHQLIPDTVTAEVTKDGNLKEISRSQAGEIIRENKVTVYLSLPTLLSFREWLNKKIEEMESKGLLTPSRGE